MNKSKFLKRSLATLLAILMVVAMVPSAFAAEGDPVHQDLKITVDTYSATQTENGDYTVTVWDSNDLTINWAPIPGTTLKLVTGGKNPNIERTLPCKLYLAENANIEGENTYSVTLREKVGSADAVDHKLTIKVESSIPDNDATLKGIRVDNTSGNYAIGYLGDGTDSVPGYISNVTKDGIVAHAIKGEIDNTNETVTITLPFGMKPENVGFANATTPETTPFTLGGAVFATTSVHAKAEYTYNNINDAKVVVTAKTGVKNEYKVLFKQEQIFESFTNSVDLERLEQIKKDSKDNQLNVELVAGDGTDLTDYYQYNWWDPGYWVPTFETTANVKRIMGTSGAAKDTAITPDLAWDTTIKGEGLSTDGTNVLTTPTTQENMLKRVTSDHAKWNLTADKADYVYLLVRTAANPSGAFVQVNLKAVAAPKTKAVITNIQIDNVSETVQVAADQRLISMVVDDTHDIDAGNTEHRDPDDPATDCYFHIKTNNIAWIEIPNQTKADSAADDDPGDGWWATSNTTISGVNTSSDSANMGTFHFVDGVNIKSGSVTLRVHSEDGSYDDWTVRITASNRDTVGLKKVELRTSSGTVIDSSTVGATMTTPFELEVPYSYHAGTGLNNAIDSGDDKDVGDLQLWVYPDAGATVVPGNADAKISNNIKPEDRVPETDDMGDKTCTQAPNGGSDEIDTTPISNGWTTIGNIWVDDYTLDKTTNGKQTLVGGSSGTKSDFQDTLVLTVSNGKKDDSTTEAVYQVKLKRGNPDKTAKITAATANTAMDDDYLFSTATTLGKQAEIADPTSGNGLPAIAQSDIGQAYAGAVDDEGNELPVVVDSTNKTIKVQVPYDWDNDKDTFYLTGLTKEGKGVSRAVGYVNNANAKYIGLKLLDLIEQEDQTTCGAVDTTGTVFPGHAKRGFTGLTTSPASTISDNIVYVYSEAEYYAGDAVATVNANWLEDHAEAYRVYIETVGSANTGRTLNNVSVASGTGVTANFSSNYGTIAVSVPGSYNWSGYRADDSHDFKLHFDTSTGALVIDKGQYLDNFNIAKASLTDGSGTVADGKFWDERTGTAGGGSPSRPAGGVDAATVGTDISKLSEVGAIYMSQLNEYYDLNDATFFVMDGELYTYDELSGKQTRITGGHGANDKFTNSNWGEIKTKQAEIRVYNEIQKSAINYRLDLKVGEPSNAKDIISLKVGDVTATKNGSSFTANLPEDAEKEQALTLELSDMATAMVNGEPYQADRKIDVSKEVAIVVTAENGSKANFTLTTTFGDTPTPPDPDKPSSKYTDIPAAPMGDFVKEAIDKGLMVGTSATKFSPDMAVTRWQFTLIIARADVMAKNPAITNATQADAELQSQYSGTPKFDDTKNLNALYNAAIEYCNKNNIVSGIGNNKFDPNGKVTRLMAARMISDWTGLTDESKTDNTNEIKDWDKVNWGKHYVNSVYDAGLVKGYGDGTFKPTRTLSRAEAAVMLVGAFNYKTGAN